ncbi:hypothetical protein HDV01_000560 [Terramyces sp. JEL0728]|nr:hypothetical protein HDV01_000560 [Terramyces sp. JEL0728]
MSTEEKKVDVDLEVNHNNEPEEKFDVFSELDEDDAERQLGELALDFTSGLVVTEDNPNTPAFTIRTVIIAVLFSIPLAFINTVASLRDNSYTVPSTIANILAYPIGIFMAAVLPNVNIAGVSLNPGPFSVKEHVLINIIVSSASSPPYGIDNVIAQKLFYNDDSVTLIGSLMWVLTTQLLGYGVAGALRRFLIKPTAMLWPGALSQVAFFNSFHESKSLDSPDSQYYHSMSRYTAFWMAFVFMFIYEWIPAYFAPTLATVSVLCLISKSKTARFLGSAGSQRGPGILSFSLDWTLINGQYSPLYVILNSYFGAFLGGWLIGPIAYYAKAFNTPELQSNLNYGGSPISSLKAWQNSTIAFDPFPTYASRSLFDVNGYTIKIAQDPLGKGRYPYLLNPDNSLNMKNFDKAGNKLYMSPAFAFSYFCSFMSLGAMFSQTFLFYGKDLVRQFREAWNQTDSDLDAKDPHYKLMKAYKDIPETAYLIYFAVLTIACIIVCETTSFKMPFYASILAIFLGIAGAIPIGVITGITGVQPYLNIITEMVAGLMWPGETVLVMCFKSLGTNMMLQAVSLLNDLKLGHYMHISPIAMVGSQLLGTVIGALVNTLGSWWAIFNLVSTELDDDSKYHAANFQVFANAGGLWGALGPWRSFGPASPYLLLNLGYLVGFAMPFLPWLANKVYPSKIWNKVNMYIIVSSVAPVVSGFTSTLLTAFVVGFFTQGWLYYYKREFWDKYVFVIFIAFDTAAPLVTFLVAMLGIYVFPEQVEATDLSYGVLSPFAPANPNYPDYYCYNMRYDGSPSDF